MYDLYMLRINSVSCTNHWNKSISFVCGQWIQSCFFFCASVASGRQDGKRYSPSRYIWFLTKSCSRNLFPITVSVVACHTVSVFFFFLVGFQ